MVYLFSIKSLLHLEFSKRAWVQIVSYFPPRWLTSSFSWPTCTAWVKQTALCPHQVPPMCIPAFTIDSELTLGARVPLSSFPSFPSAPKTHRSEGPYAISLPEIPSSLPAALPRTDSIPTLDSTCVSPTPLSVKAILYTTSWSVLQTKSGLFPLFINKVLVEHNRTYLFMCCLLPLWCCIGRIKSLT